VTCERSGRQSFANAWSRDWEGDVPGGTDVAGLSMFFTTVLEGWRCRRDGASRKTLRAIGGLTRGRGQQESANRLGYVNACSSPPLPSAIPQVRRMCNGGSARSSRHRRGGRGKHLGAVSVGLYEPRRPSRNSGS